MLDLALSLGADALHLFMLVPVGLRPRDRAGRDAAGRRVRAGPALVRRAGEDLPDRSQGHLRAALLTGSGLSASRRRGAMGDYSEGVHRAGHARQGGAHAAARQRRPRPAPVGDDPGCLAGTSVCFISNVGKVYPCGYLPVSAGDTLTQAFSEIWNASPLFEELRNPDAYEGKCGVCRYEAICGGCRARAYAATGNFMSEEPFCLYQPGRQAPEVDPSLKSRAEALTPGVRPLQRLWFA
jgi:radical SAM protein with 4Fe4S-binding SPASM domain